MINLNVNFTVVFDGKQTTEQRNIALNELEQALERFKPYCAVSTLASNHKATQGTLDANKAYLASKGYARTPKVGEPELKLRELFTDKTDSDWLLVQTRHELLLTKGYDIFDVNRDKLLVNGDSSQPPIDAGAELVTGIDFSDIASDNG